MLNDAQKLFLMNVGWDHVFYEPPISDKVKLREYVKGPFKKTKVTCPVLRLSFPERVDSSFCYREGIPDCWRDYFIHKFILTYPFLSSYESMHKEDVHVVDELRKKYRLYLGQGIPDPWLSYPNVNPTSSRDFKNLIGRQILSLLNERGNDDHYRKESCLCCEKKYLFQCPDKTETGVKDRNTLNCTCQDCHGKSNTTECSDHCKCIQTLQKWVLENTNLIKDPNRKSGKIESSQSNSLSPRHSNNVTVGLQYPEQKSSEPQNRFRKSRRDYNTSSAESDTSKSEIREIFPSNKENKTKDETEGKVMCLCSYARNASAANALPKNENSSLRRKSSPQQGVVKPVGRVVRDIQTQTQVKKVTKGSQTEGSRIKGRYEDQDCYGSITECRGMMGNCSYSGKSRPKFCFPYGSPITQTCSCAPNKVHKQDSQESRHKRKEEEQRRLNDEEDSDSDNNYHQHHQRQSRDDYSVKKDRKSNDSQKDSYKRIYYCQTLPRAFEHLKYLTGNTVKGHLQQRDILSGPKTRLSSLNQPSPPISKSFYEPTYPEKYNPEKWRQYRAQNLDKSDYVLPEKGLRKVSKATGHDDVPIKVKYYKDMVDSDESRTYGLIRNNEKSRGVRKRKKYLIRKRRKLAGAKTSLSKLPYKFANKNIQVDVIKEESSVDTTQAKQPNPQENYLTSSRFIDFRQRNDFQSSKVAHSSLEKTKGDVSKRDFIKAFLAKSQKRSDVPFGEVFERISHNNGTTWSSNTLKNIVNELLIEKKVQQSKETAFA